MTLSSTAIDFFRSRGSVLFISYCRFWEKHGFVQQSLARTLVENGISVYWLDGVGWRRYEPKHYWDSPLLRVEQLPQLPARRVSALKSASLWLQKKYIDRLVEKLGRPLIWVQGGVEYGLEKKVPYVDVYSTFDDPYRHRVTDPMCEKAKLILCQNTFTWRLFQKTFPEKSVVFLPPVLGSAAPVQRAWPRPKRMGYIGSFFSYDYDLNLFERFVRQLPEIEFLIAGRTDDRGYRWVERMKKFRNFSFRQWVSPLEVDKLWNTLGLTLLFYKDSPFQHGAFPVKVLDAVRNGLSCICTNVPKTQDLRDFFPTSNHPDQLVQKALDELHRPIDEIEGIFKQLRIRMSPVEQIESVAKWLSEEASLQSVSSDTEDLARAI